MQDVVLASGRGRRLRRLTDERSKSSVEPDDRPTIDDCIEELVSFGVDSIVVVGYVGDQIRERYGISFDGIPIDCVTHDRRDGLASTLLTLDSGEIERAERFVRSE